jgi:hypothetical protein
MTIGSQMLRRIFRNRRSDQPPSVRKIIAHGHIFKNAGTTLDWALKRNFGSGFVDHRDDEPMRQEGAPYLLEYINARPELKAISSHHLCYPLPVTEQITVLPVYLLRHPIERVLSVYEYEKKQKGSTPGAINAKKMDIAEYVRWRLTPDSGATIRNYQVRYLSGMHRFPRRPVTEAEFDAALANAGNALVGLVEELDQSFVEFERILRDRGFTELDLAYVPQNVNAGRPSTATERVDVLRARIGDALFDELTEANQFDGKLYALTNTAMAERRQSDPSLEADLASFRSRSEHLR